MREEYIYFFVGIVIHELEVSTFMEAFRTFEDAYYFEQKFIKGAKNAEHYSYISKFSKHDLKKVR